MRIIIYDCEVFKYDWLVVMKDHESGEYTVILNDNEALKACINEDCIYIGFNSKHYDQFIIKAIWLGCSPEEIKELNDFIIGGGQGWEYPLMRENYMAFNNVDIKDDMQMGLSLKAIEGHLGLSVQETTVPFDLPRPLTPEEIEEVIFYCKHDVDTTEKVVELRKNYLKSKVSIGRLAGLSDVRAMAMTNAKLTAAMLSASKKPHKDEREYQYPENLKREYIPHMKGRCSTIPTRLRKPLCISPGSWNCRGSGPEAPSSWVCSTTSARWITTSSLTMRSGSTTTLLSFPDTARSPLFFCNGT